MTRSVPLALAVLPVLALLAGAPLEAGENWPQFRGPTGDGHSDATGLPLRWSETENVRWKTAIHGRGWSSPVVWGGQIWLTTATLDGKKLYAVQVDRESGEMARDIRLFDVASPREKHKLNSYASPTPVIEEGRLYVHFGSYGTACLDTKTGDRVWERRDLPCNHWRGPGSSPILFGRLVIVHFDGFDQQYVVALDKATGKTVWRTDRSNDYGTDDGDFKKAYSTPLVIQAAGRTQLISPGSRATTAYDPRTGKELWQVRFREFSSTARPLYGHGLVFINTGFGKARLLAVRPDGEGDVSDSHIAWTLRKGVGSKPSPLLVGDLLFLVDDGGVASCVEARTGKHVWTERLGGNFSASPVQAEGRIYFSSHEGVTTVIRPRREFEKLAENQLDDGFMSSPAIAGRALFLRTRSHLYRIERPDEKAAGGR
ncbi:MAG: PQQ-binding-like beta-propeller repeat protein [Planctomycetota bacterium]|nr:PQQ-binding-like beta-propeller repeat protein [Planctomycetota bacterium]